MEADRKKLIDKIVKLLALANSSDFSEEAKTAKNLEAELLAKHDIAVFELEDGAPYTCERGNRGEVQCRPQLEKYRIKGV